MIDEPATEHVPERDEIIAFNESVVRRFRANEGHVDGLGHDLDVLLITVTGARTHRQRTVPLAYLELDGHLVVIGSFRGSSKNPAWVHNVRTNPVVLVEIGTRAFLAEVHERVGPDRDYLFARAADVAPAFARYQAGVDRVIPVFELHEFRTPTYDHSNPLTPHPDPLHG